MAFVISGSCVDVMDRSCIDVCPVDCIYEGARKLYVQPDECVDCGACEPVCPEQAISYVDDVPESAREFIGDNARFFTEILPGRAEPLGVPGGARDVPPVGVDTALVAGYPTVSSSAG